MHTFPDFDRDVRRPFAVDEDCYDCGEFYHGCNGCPASAPARCRDRLRLPDVPAGTTGQTIPPSRMGERKEPRLCQETTADHQEPARTPAPAPVRRKDTRTKPAASPAGPRLCGCGATLPKGRRLCDTCRAQSRRQTMREYMRTRRATPPEFRPVSGMPLSATATHATRATAGNLLPVGHPAGVGRSEQTTV